jgi:hypothetical protein
VIEKGKDRPCELRVLVSVLVVQESTVQQSRVALRASVVVVAGSAPHDLGADEPIRSVGCNFSTGGGGEKSRSGMAGSMSWVQVAGNGDQR